MMAWHGWLWHVTKYGKPPTITETENIPQRPRLKPFKCNWLVIMCCQPMNTKQCLDEPWYQIGFTKQNWQVDMLITRRRKKKSPTFRLDGWILAAGQANVIFVFHWSVVESLKSETFGKYINEDTPWEEIKVRYIESVVHMVRPRLCLAPKIQHILQFVLYLFHSSRNSAGFTVYRSTNHFCDLVPLLKPLLNFRITSWAKSFLKDFSSSWNKFVQFVYKFIFLNLFRHLCDSCHHFFQRRQHQNIQIRIPFESTVDTATCNAQSHLKTYHCHDCPILGWKSHGAHLAKQKRHNWQLTRPKTTSRETLEKRKTRNIHIHRISLQLLSLLP